MQALPKQGAWVEASGEEPQLKPSQYSSQLSVVKFESYLILLGAPDNRFTKESIQCCCNIEVEVESYYKTLRNKGRLPFDQKFRNFRNGDE